MATAAIASAVDKIEEHSDGGHDRHSPMANPSCSSLVAAAERVDRRSSDALFADVFLSTLPPPSAASWPTAAIDSSSLRGAAEATAVDGNNPLSRLAVQLRKLGADARQATSPVRQATRLGNAAAAAPAAQSLPTPYRPLYCEGGLEHAVYKTLPMRNELDQYLEIVAKRQRKGRVPFVETCFPAAQHDWAGREAQRRASWPSADQPPPRQQHQQQQRIATTTRPLPPLIPLAAPLSHSFVRVAGPVTSLVSEGGRVGGPAMQPQQRQQQPPVRLTRLTTFAEVERQKTVTYDLHTKLKAMLADK